MNMLMHTRQIAPDFWKGYWKHSIGFDRMVDTLLDTEGSFKGFQDNYPPYDIVKSGEDSYCIEMALAGFTKEEISVEVKEEYLTIAGDASDRHDNSDYVHKGIAKRGFQKRFLLSDTIEVEGAELTDGVLHIKLKENIPEEQRPKLITIN